jgi:alkylhydroperoxidase AhpD family core domain
MPIFKPIQESESKGKVKEIYDEIKTTRQITEVPNFWKMLANDPNELDRTWSSLKEIMKKGALDPVTKELIYVAVSITNSCEYCIKSHSVAAKKKGATNEMLKKCLQ